MPYLRRATRTTRAVNKALGANIDVRPANGNTYDTTIPILVAGDKLPDWIQLPTQWNATFDVGALAAQRFADLAPYLSKGNIRKYPNLAAIATGGWESGAWEGKLYGLPSFFVDNGKLVHWSESPRTEAALEFAHKLAKSGYVHPSALANDRGERAGRRRVGHHRPRAARPVVLQMAVVVLTPPTS